MRRKYLILLYNNALERFEIAPTLVSKEADAESLYPHSLELQFCGLITHPTNTQMKKLKEEYNENKRTSGREGSR